MSNEEENNEEREKASVTESWWVLFFIGRSKKDEMPLDILANFAYNEIS